MKQIAWMVLAWLLLSFPAQAASFDCKKAQTKVEKMICADTELSKLDEELSAAYKTALQEDKEQAKVIRQSQKNWMKYRDSQKNVESIKAAYEGRLSNLTVTHRYKKGGSIDMREPGYPFNLKEGKGIEVCEVYRKNLEALHNPNLACEREVSPEYAGIIKLTDWRKLDLWENRNLWAQAEKIIHGGLYTPEAMESKKTSMDDQRTVDELAERYHANIERYNREVYKLYVADMDINNDGRNELVLRNHSGLCGEPVTYKAIELFILNEKGDTVDIPNSV